MASHEILATLLPRQVPGWSLSPQHQDEGGAGEADDEPHRHDRRPTSHVASIDEVPQRTRGSGRQASTLSPTGAEGVPVAVEMSELRRLEPAGSRIVGHATGKVRQAGIVEEP